MRLETQKWLGMLLTVLGLSMAGFSLWQNQPEPSPATALNAVDETPKVSDTAERVPCKVLTVYDGDTLGCDLNHNGRVDKPTEEIRLLGIDTPEMHYSRKNKTHDSDHPTDEPWAKEASAAMQQMAARQTVYLTFDIRRSDKYGRTLAYVYPAKNSPAEDSLNQRQLTTGLATTLFIGKNRALAHAFETAENEARQAGRGLWGNR
ncbi:MAG: thermonuclease family protein [Candidatus Melainabacteria bacterium]